MSSPESEDRELVGLPRPGEVIAEKYRVQRLLGKGGMGAVYVAHHEILNQPVALKLLLPQIAESQDAVARFLNEARAAAQIRNEHVAQVMDVGKLDNGSAFMVLEYLEGADLAAVQEQRGALSAEEAVDYVLQALEAIAQAHALGIVHRDLKPANLFLSRRQDGTPIIKVLDFGISKAVNPLQQPGNAAVTATKALLGSPGYMSPEQVRSSKNVDARTDIWSVGVILYRLLTNAAPFDGDTLGAIFAAIIEDSPRTVREHRPEIPVELDAIVTKCLQRDRDKRWPSCAELALALSPYAGGEAALSVDRICRTLSFASGRTPAAGAMGQARGSQSAPAWQPSAGSSTGPGARGAAAPVGASSQGAAHRSTASPWSGSQPPPVKTSTRAWVIGGVAIAAMAALGVVGMQAMSRGTAASAPPPIVAAPPAEAVTTPATTAAAAVTAPAVTAMPDPVASGSTAPPVASASAPPPVAQLPAAQSPGAAHPVTAPPPVVVKPAAAAAKPPAAPPGDDTSVLLNRR